MEGCTTLSQDEIDNLLSSLSVGMEQTILPQGEEGAASSHEKRNFTLYNFRRPDKFSKDHLRALQTIHESFARQLGLVLSAYLRMTVEINVVSVDQLTYDEFIRSMPSPMTVSILELDPLPGQVLMGMGYEVTSSVIDRMLGGTGVVESKTRELTDVEQLLIRRIIDRATVALEDAWRSVLSINVALVGMEESYTFIQVATPGEIVALVTFEVNLSNRDSGLISFCIPYPVLEGVVSQLSAQHIFHRQQSNVSQEQQEQILQKLTHAHMPIQVLLGGTEIHIKELMELNVGDVIQLDRRINENMLACVNGKPKFYCRPGTLRKNLAVFITEEIEDEEAIEGFGFDGK